MSYDAGPSDPYHELLISPKALRSFSVALRRFFDLTGLERDTRLEVSEAVRNFGFGRCRVTQIVVYWNPSLVEVGEAELMLYARTLALAHGCELADLWVVPQHVEEFGPEMVRALTERPADYLRLGVTLERLKRRRSEAATAGLGKAE